MNPRLVRIAAGTLGAVVLALPRNSADASAGGFTYESTGGTLQLEAGGRIQNDWAWFFEDDGMRAAKGDLIDGTEFRRARLYAAGRLYGNVEFKAEYDFAGGAVTFKDLYMGLADCPGLGTVRVGFQKEPFGLEQMTSGKYLTFMERALPVAFNPSRNTGILVANVVMNGRATWSAGIFRDTGETGNGSEEGKYNVTARATALPLAEAADGHLVHLGVSYSRRNPNGDLFAFAQGPESHLAPALVDTGTRAARGLQLLGAEGAFVKGPLSLQAEAVVALVDSDVLGDPAFNGYYACGSYFLTGEHRPYERGTATFGRVRPAGNFSHEAPGAWELAVRFSHLDLDDGPVRGGVLEDVTAAVNWYLNPNTMVTANYIHADLEETGTVGIYQMRCQIDF